MRMSPLWSLNIHAGGQPIENKALKASLYHCRSAPPYSCLRIVSNLARIILLSLVIENDLPVGVLAITHRQKAIDR
jgi:hypothetical protein